VLSPTVDPCRVDRGQFEAAILNLVVNARDAMPSGGQITIETRNAALTPADLGDAPEVGPGAYTVLAIGDTGEGMAPEVLAKAFEPFFTTKEVGRGSGLGLSMVYGFVQQSGGHVRIRSEPGIGTTVTLYLPSSSEAAPVAATSGATERAPTGSETILVVEDNTEVLEVAAIILAELGYELVAATGPEEALAMLRGSRRIDALFTDLVMPGGMAGDQLAREARVLRPGIKVLLATGYASHVAGSGAELDGFPVITKPYRRAELAQRLREVFAAR
jgi:CheY-like chemotaxis protein